MSSRNSSRERRAQLTGGGGAATAGGMNFQAAVTAIVASHIASGQSLSWLPELVTDVPISLCTETGGPGDDLELTLSSRAIGEAQVKKLLTAGPRLWESLEALAVGIHEGRIAFGVLVVCPDSTRSIAIGLANDLVRLGEGRMDRPCSLRSTLLKILTARNLPVITVCQRLRIRRVHALDHDDADVQMAYSLLSRVIEQREKPVNAWNSLYRAAHNKIAQSGAWDAPSVLRVLAGDEIALRTDGDTPAAHLLRLTAWTKAVNSTLTTVGSRQSLSLRDVWFDLAALSEDPAVHSSVTLQEALHHYHTGPARSQDEKLFDARTIGRFRRLAVILGGPGAGKSTLGRCLALDYAEDGFPVVRVPLGPVARMMKESGLGFEAAVFRIGLGAAGLDSEQLLRIGVPHWVLVCDGLDETGSQQDAVAEGAVNFATAHPTARIIITTRPIGYHTGRLSSWAHYRLVWPDWRKPGSSFTRLVTYLSPADSVPDGATLAKEALQSPHIEALIAHSPFMASLVALLVARGRRVPQTVVELYRDILRLVNDEPPPRLVVDPPPRPTAERVLYALGWYLQQHPLASASDGIAHCGRTLADQLGITVGAAEDHVDRCLAYWHALGVVERVRHAEHDMLTFVHKSLGEFAAAKHLVSLPEATRAQAIAQCDALPEVQKFGASLGLASEITEWMLTSATTSEARFGAVERPCS